MVLSISNERALAIVDSIVDELDSGTIRIYSGSVPTLADTALSGNTILAELVLGAPAFGAAADATGAATATANAITDDSSANATGTATFFRAFDNGDTCVLQGTVGTSGTDMTITSTSIEAGVTVEVTSWTVSISE